MEEQNNSAKFYNKEWKEIFRQPVSSFCRVMWYLRWCVYPNPNIQWWMLVTDENRNIPIFIDWYNIGKKSEFYSRKWFSEEKSNNSKFIRKYGI